MTTLVLLSRQIDGSRGSHWPVSKPRGHLIRGRRAELLTLEPLSCRAPPSPCGASLFSSRDFPGLHSLLRAAPGPPHLCQASVSSSRLPDTWPPSQSHPTGCGPALHLCRPSLSACRRRPSHLTPSCPVVLLAI